MQIFVLNFAIGHCKLISHFFLLCYGKGKSPEVPFMESLCHTAISIQQEAKHDQEKISAEQN